MVNVISVQVCKNKLDNFAIFIIVGKQQSVQFEGHEQYVARICRNQEIHIPTYT